jgi:hypothetical protein
MKKSLHEHLLLLKATTDLVVDKKGRRVEEEVESENDDAVETDISDFADEELDENDRSMDNEENVVVETKRKREDSDDETETLDQPKQKKAKTNESRSWWSVSGKCLTM